jgi:hypothetical protein
VTQDWQELTRLTQGNPIVVEKVRLIEGKITIEGEFELPPLAKLTSEDQVFVMAFVKCEGTIKEMEKSFGVSYPTIKARLGKIAKQLEFVETVVSQPRDEILASLERGEISAHEAIERLSK